MQRVNFEQTVIHAVIYSVSIFLTIFEIVADQYIFVKIDILFECQIFFLDFFLQCSWVCNCDNISYWALHMIGCCNSWKIDCTNVFKSVFLFFFVDFLETKICWLDYFVDFVYDDFVESLFFFLLHLNVFLPLFNVVILFYWTY